MEVFFCEVCTRRVSDVELDRGEGRRDGDRVWCRRCIEHAPTVKEPSRPPSTRTRPKTGVRLAPVGGRPASGRKAVLGLGVVAGLVLALVAGVVSFSGDRERTGKAKRTSSRRHARPGNSRRSPSHTPTRVARSSSPAARRTGDASVPSRTRVAVSRSRDREKRADARRAETVRKAREALREAVERAEELAGEGDFDGAGEALRALPGEYYNHIAGELRAARDRFAIEAGSRVDELLAAAGAHLAGGRIAEARASLEKLGALRFSVAVPTAPGRLEELRGKIHEAASEALAAAGELAERDLAGSLGEFETLVAEGRYALARRKAESLATGDTTEDKPERVVEALRAAARVAASLEERRGLLRLALEQKKGQTVSIATRNGSRRGEVAEIDDDGFSLVTKVMINRRVTGTRKQRVAWGELTVAQAMEFLGGREDYGPDDHMAEALVAATRGDAEGADAAFDRATRPSGPGSSAPRGKAAGGHPLASRVRALIEIARMGDPEEAAAKRWAGLTGDAAADDLAAPDVRRLLGELDEFEARLGETEFADGHALDIARLRARLTACATQRVTRGLVALYRFEEGEGTVVRDTSGVEPAVDLRIENPAAVRWLNPGADGQRGVEVTSPGKIIDSGGAGKLLEKIRATGEVSIEARFRPANLTQIGPGRIVTFSSGTLARNFTLGQEGPKVVFRLRTTVTGANGMPQLETTGGALRGDAVHVVATFSEGKRRFFLNGEPYPQALNTPGDLGSWEPFRLVLANEVTGDRAWLGSIFLVAVYDRALTAEEARRNFEMCR